VSEETLDIKDKTRQRLEQVKDPTQKLRPFRKSDQLTRCALYWLPVTTFPAGVEERHWVLQFFDRLAKKLAEDRGLHCELFLQQKIVQGELMRTFLRSAADLSAVVGLSRRPGEQLPPPPSMQDVKDLQEGRKSFRASDYLGDYCYWFLDGDDHKARELFLGYGGLSMAFLKPDPKAAPPNLPIPRMFTEHFFFQQINLKAKIAAAARMSDPFMLKTKELFGTGLEEEPQYRGLLFITPLLRSEDFFKQPAEEIKKVFEVFDLYVNESPSDQGIIFAAKESIDDLLGDIVESMRQDGMVYPIGVGR
jgi:hypothetical protein